MLGKPSLVRSILTAVVLSAALVSCTDAPITSSNPPTRTPFGSIQGLDSVPVLPGDSAGVQGCVEDQEESPETPDKEESPCYLPPIVVTPPPSEPAPPPPSEPTPEPGSGGTPTPPAEACDPTVDYDPDCARCADGYLYDEATGDCIDSADVAELGCPQSYNGWWSFVWEGHTFYFLGKLERTKTIKSWPWGEAEYRLPPGPITSTDNKAIFWSGIGKMKCYGYLAKNGQFKGLLNLTWHSGDIREF